MKKMEDRVNTINELTFRINSDKEYQRAVKKITELKNKEKTKENIKKILEFYQEVKQKPLIYLVLESEIEELLEREVVK